MEQKMRGKWRRGRWTRPISPSSTAAAETSSHLIPSFLLSADVKHWLIPWDGGCGKLYDQSRVAVAAAAAAAMLFRAAEPLISQKRKMKTAKEGRGRREAKEE